MTKKKITEAALLILLVCAAVFAASFFGAHIGAGKKSAEAAAKVSLDPAADAVAESTRSISIPGYEALQLKAQQTQQTEQSIYLYNPAGNSCYFSVSLLFDDVELFTTGLIAPGEDVRSVNMRQKIPAGEYENANLRYSCYDLNTMSELNGADVILRLEVSQ